MNWLQKVSQAISIEKLLLQLSQNLPEPAMNMLVTNISRELMKLGPEAVCDVIDDYAQNYPHSVRYYNSVKQSVGCPDVAIPPPDGAQINQEMNPQISKDKPFVSVQE